MPVLHLPFRRDSEASRGQALVELAVVLPILALLLVMALDFGRVFFGWVGLQNGARIAADFAARNADTWPEDRSLYQELVISDMQAINCAPPPALDANGNGRWDAADVPDPTFEDVDGNGKHTDDGDYAKTALSCRFDVMTPLASIIVGSPVALGAEAYFPINNILAPAVPAPENPPPGPCTAPTALYTLQETPPSGPGGNATDGRGSGSVTIVFTDTSTEDTDCPIATWSWKENGTEVDSTPGPVTRTFVHPTGSNPHVSFIFALTVTTDDGLSSTYTKTIRVDP